MDKTVPVCPVCTLPVERVGDVPFDECIDAHIASGCRIGVQKKHSVSKRGVETCLVPRCKELVMLLSCGGCERVVCVKHRQEHVCVPPVGGHKGKGKTAVVGIDTRSPAQLAAARRQISVK